MILVFSLEYATMPHMQIEFELRILNIDKQALVKKLEALGATKVHDEVLQRRYIMDFPDGRLGKQHAWVRVRKVGDLRVECTLKQRLDNTAIKNAQEIEFEVSDFDRIVEFLEFLGLQKIGYKENFRLRYHFEGATLDIDTFPQLNPYLEIEGLSEEHVHSVGYKLGFNDNDFVYKAGKELFLDLGISLEQQRDLRFTNHADHR